MTVKTNSGEFGSTTIQRAARLAIAATATFGLLIGSGVTATAANPAATPAGAIPEYGGGTLLQGILSATEKDTCRFAGGGSDSQSKSLRLAESGSLSISNSYPVSAGFSRVGTIQASAQQAAKPVVRNGGLTRADFNTSGMVMFEPSGSSATCGDASGLIGLAGASAQPITSQPTGAGGWLTLTVNHSGAGQTNVLTSLMDAADNWTDLPTLTTTSSRTTGMRLPPRHLVQIWVASETGIAPRSATQPVASSWSSKVRAVVTPFGGALRSQSGSSTARRSVSLPSAVSCSGKARVSVRSYAKSKKMKSVRIYVNGKTVNKISRVKKKTYTVKVPRKGHITIKAKVTSKHGKTRTTTRTYAPCG